MAFNLLFESHNWCLICSWEPGSLSWHVSGLTDCLCVCLEILVSPADPNQLQSVHRQRRATRYATQDSLSSFMGITIKAPRITVKYRVSDTGEQTENMLSASDESVMANETGNDIHSRLCIFSVVCHHTKGIVDKGSLSRSDIVLEWKNTQSGWAVIFWWDKPPDFPFLRHLLQKCMPGIAPPPNILQPQEGAERKGVWALKFSGVLVFRNQNQEKWRIGWKKVKFLD